MPHKVILTLDPSTVNGTETKIQSSTNTAVGNPIITQWYCFISSKISLSFSYMINHPPVTHTVLLTEKS